MSYGTWVQEAAAVQLVAASFLIGETMDKPFLAIDDQVSLLAKRGVKTDSNTATVLMREGYYSVINGYKAPFLDLEKTKASDDDRYLSGTSFEDIYALFVFDRKLREITFHYHTKIEVMMRTICSYTFCEHHREKNAYLQPESYTLQSDYMLDSRAWQADITKLVKTFKKKLDGYHEHHEFIDFYKENHDNVPLWVLANALTFGNIEHLYDLMKPDEQQLVCERVVTAINKQGSQQGFLNRRMLRIYLNVLVKVRNLCAHDERLYCAQVGTRNKTDYFGSLHMAEKLLTQETTDEYFQAIEDLIINYRIQGGSIVHVLKAMNPPSIDFALTSSYEERVD